MNTITFGEVSSFYMDALSLLGVNSSDIRRADLDIACKCPICGDSRIGNKKRLHLYQKGDVINVNCFNGDCPVVNMAPYSFFKEYVPRIFQEYQNFNRKRFLLTIQANSSNDFSNVKPKNQLETMTADFDLNDYEIPESVESEDPDEYKLELELLDTIQRFKFTNNEVTDLDNFRALVKEIKSDDKKYSIFRDWIN